MEAKYNIAETLIPVINVEKTALKFKEIRESRNITVRDVQKHFNFEYPQAIYYWEDPTVKTIPTPDNIFKLASFYKVHVEDLFVLDYIKGENTVVKECSPIYGNTSSDLDCIKDLVSGDLLIALRNCYGY